MSVAAVRRVVRRLAPDRPATDAELVRAVAGPDRESAFAELIARHGPMVLGACRRILADAHDAEDAFQAAFLVLARKAHTIRPPGAVAGWLHGVAVRTSRKAKVAAARRRRREMAAVTANPDRKVGGGDEVGGGGEVGTELDRAELRAVIDGALAALPQSHRAAVVLCDLHGKTRAEVAAELDRPEGTVASWLARGRKALAARLARRGFALPVAGIAAVAAPAVVSAELASTTVAALLGRGASPAALALAEGVARGLTAGTKLAVGLVAVGLLLAAVATAGAWPDGDPKPEVPPIPLAASAPKPEEPKPKAEPERSGFLEHKGYVYSVAYAPDGTRFLTVGGGSVTVWEAATRKRLFSSDAEFAAFSADGKHVFALVDDKSHTLDATTGKVTTTFPRWRPKPVGPGLFAAFTPNGGGRVEYNGAVHQPTVLPIKGALPAFVDQHAGADDRAVEYGRGGAFSPNGERFAGIHSRLKNGRERGVLSVWGLLRGDRVGTIYRDYPVQCFAWSPDGTEIAVGYGDGVRVYLADPKARGGADPDATDPGTFRRVRKFVASGATAVAYSKDGKLLAVAAALGPPDDPVPGRLESRAVSVAILDAATGKDLRWFTDFAPNLPVVALAFSPDGSHLVCGAGFFPGAGPSPNAEAPKKDAPTLRVLALDPPAKPQPAWEETQTLALNGWLGGSVAFSAAGKMLFVGGTGGHVRAYSANTLKPLWDAQEGDHFSVVAPSIEPLFFVEADGVYIAQGVKEGIRLRDAATGKPGHLFKGEWNAEPLAIAWFASKHTGNFNAPGVTERKLMFVNGAVHQVLSWSEGPGVTLADSLKQVSQAYNVGRPADEHSVALAVSTDGKGCVLTTPTDVKTGKNYLRLWDAGSDVRSKTLEGHKAAVVCAAWSKDRGRLVTGDADGEVIAWNVTDFTVQSRVKLGGRVAGLALTPDGKLVAAAVVQPQENKAGGERYAEEMFVWETAAPPAKPEPISSEVAGGPFKGVASVAFSPDGKALASAFANFDHLARGGRLVGRVRLFAPAAR